MTMGRTVVASTAILLFGLLFCLGSYAGSSDTHVPGKPSEGAVTDPFRNARLQIERLRRTASQLRLLGEQPVPTNMPTESKTELARHEQWLGQAQRRIRVLARAWEDGLGPLSARNKLEAADGVNAFFAAQAARLQTKLRRESLAHEPRWAHVRSSATAARLVIGNMRYGEVRADYTGRRR